MDKESEKMVPMPAANDELTIEERLCEPLSSDLSAWQSGVDRWMLEFNKQVKLLQHQVEVLHVRQSCLIAALGLREIHEEVEGGVTVRYDRVDVRSAQSGPN